MRFRRRKKESLLLDAAKGVVAGAVATFAMGQLTSYLCEKESTKVRKTEDKARRGKSAYVIAAEKAARAGGRRLSAEQVKQAGSAIQWGVGMGAAVGYALMRKRIPNADLGRGLLLGTLFWLLVDEGANVALGLTPGPTKFPWQTHARGLAGHAAFGIAADRGLRALDRFERWWAGLTVAAGSPTGAGRCAVPVPVNLPGFST